MLQFCLFSQYIRWRLIEPIKRFFTTPLPLPTPPPPPPSPPPSLHTFTQHALEEERVGVSNGRYSSKKIGEVLREGRAESKNKRVGGLFKLPASRLHHRFSTEDNSTYIRQLWSPWYETQWPDIQVRCVHRMKNAKNHPSSASERSFSWRFSPRLELFHTVYFSAQYIFFCGNKFLMLFHRLDSSGRLSCMMFLC